MPDQITPTNNNRMTTLSGIILLDNQLSAEFMNVAVRRMWRISEELAARKPPFAELVGNTRATNLLRIRCFLSKSTAISSHCRRYSVVRAQ